MDISKNDLSRSLIDTLSDRLDSVNEKYAEFQLQNETLAVSDNVLSVVTFNTALLCRPDYINSENNCNIRRSHYASQLDLVLSAEDGVDVLMLQEIWGVEDFAMFRDLAEDNGYHAFFHDEPSDETYGSGLQILVRKSSFPAEKIIEHGFKVSTRALWERLSDVDRGLLYVVLESDNGKKILVGNIHNTPDVPVLDYYQRDRQTEQLSQTITSFRNDVDHFVIGGDFNYSPDFVLDNHLGVLDTQLGARSYINFAEKNQIFEMVDTYRAVNDDSGFTWDEINNTFIEDYDFLTTQKRLDLIWLGSFEGAKAYVESSRIIFDEYVKDDEGENVIFEGEPFHISDHFGVLSTVRY
jgi:endonuclease/exonuclease/phosphatase family metal-dependent hydrolase